MTGQEGEGRGLALVTGASSGIGEAFAERLAQDGLPLLLVARREERLRDLATTLADRYDVQVGFAVADLTTEAGRQTCRDAVDAVGGVVDTVVLNAGFGAMGNVHEIGRERQTSMVALNCEAVVDLATHVLPGMVERGYGTIIIVSSAAAFQPIPYTATYAATKVFELAFAEALEFELRGTGVDVIAVCPGPTTTEFGQAAGASVTSRWLRRDSVQTVVDQTWDALAKGRSRVSTGKLAKVAGIASAVLPRRMVIWAAGVLHRKFQRHSAH